MKYHLAESNFVATVSQISVSLHIGQHHTSSVNIERKG